MVIWSTKGKITTAELDGEEWTLLQKLLARVKPETEMEAAFLSDVGISSDFGYEDEEVE